MKLKTNNTELQEALAHPVWKAHKTGNTYKMDGKGEWKITYYPIFECGKTGEVYDSPRALVESKAIWNGVEGTDFREVPLHYLELNCLLTLSVWIVADLKMETKWKKKNLLECLKI